MRRRHQRSEMQGMGLVQLHHGHVGLQGAAPVDFGQQRRDDAAGEVASGRVGEDPQAVLPQHRDQHLGRGGLTVGAGHHHDATWDMGQRMPKHARVDGLGDQSRQGRTATAEARDDPRRAARSQCCRQPGLGPGLHRGTTTCIVTPTQSCRAVCW